MKNKRFFALMSAIAVFTLTSGIALAAGPFYEGKVVRIIVGSSPGGGMDLYARALARHMGRYIPGTPAVIVDNMPGAGFLIATNYLYKIAKPDGLTLGYVNAGVFLSQFLGQPGIEFEARKFGFVGSLNKDNSVCILNRARGIKSIGEWVASKTPVKLGGMGVATGQDNITRIWQKEIGLPIQLVSPFKGSSDIWLAMQRGEIDGSVWSFDSLKVVMPKALEAGDIIIVLQAVPKPLPGLSNVPLWMNLAKTNEARQMIELLNIQNELGRPFIVPPETPNDCVEILRKAIQETVKDSEFLAEMEKARMGLEPSTGEELQNGINQFFRVLDPALIPRLKEILYGP
jgi:tripartite-type tricarboxylate transporter receptor subunit TctC